MAWWMAAIPAAASVFGSMTSAGGQRDANKANIQLAREQMAFQERMSSTAHQREVEDLRKAGLNRILSATGGAGASTPAGQTANIVNPDKAFEGLGHSAKEALRLKQEIRNMKATALETEARERLVNEQLALTNINKASAHENFRMLRNEADLSDRLKPLDAKIYSGKLGELLRRAQLLSSPVNSASSIGRLFK